MTNFERFVYGFKRMSWADKTWLKLLNDELSNADHKTFFYTYLQPSHDR
jgi:hypothetical protein